MNPNQIEQWVLTKFNNESQPIWTISPNQKCTNIKRMIIFFPIANPHSSSMLCSIVSSARLLLPTWQKLCSITLIIKGTISVKANRKKKIFNQRKQENIPLECLTCSPLLHVGLTVMTRRKKLIENIVQNLEKFMRKSTTFIKKSWLICQKFIPKFITVK